MQVKFRAGGCGCFNCMFASDSRNDPHAMPGPFCMQTLHASAEEAVKQLTSQLRELQAGGSSAAQSAAAEAAALSATVDTLRREATLAKDTGDAHEQVRTA